MRYILDKGTPNTWFVEDAQVNLYATITENGDNYKIVTVDEVKATFDSITKCMVWFMRDGDTYDFGVKYMENVCKCCSESLNEIDPENICMTCVDMECNVND